MPVEMNRAEFEDLVAEALDLVPDELSRHMENVAVVVADVPTPAQRRHARGRTLLGLYQGVALTRRSAMSYQAVMPDRITIFRHAHLAISPTVDALRRRVAKTVIHEIGHHFGISDERLHELGW